MIHKTNKKIINELKSIGYCKIENFLSSEQIKELDNNWNSILSTAIKQQVRDELLHQNVAKNSTSELYKKDGKWDLWKSHYILIQSELGRKYIKAVESLMQQINPDLIYMKDRIMNQGPETKGHMPHQDTSSGQDAFYEKFTTGELYTMYISLTDTNQDNGCLWLEETTQRRSNRLGYCDNGCVKGNTCLCTNWEHKSEKIKFYNGHIMKPMPQKSGDAVIFDGYALHGTGKNITNTTRKTVLIMYAVPKPEFKHIDKNKFWEYTRGNTDA